MKFLKTEYSMSPAPTLSLVILVLAVLFVGLNQLGKVFQWSAELRRKSIHISLGLVCLSFPWLFEENWPVLVLCIVALVSLLTLRLVPKLQKSMGQSLHAVKRLSLGEILFPIAVAWSFVAAGENTILYVVAISILTLADAGGALIGVKFGKNRFTTLKSGKSIEGSICFFALAFLCIFIPLLIDQQTALANSILIAFTLALLATLVEGISAHGFDNLFLPISAVLLLELFLKLDFQQLAFRCAILFLCLGFILALRKFSTLDGGGLLGAIFYAYACYTMGDRWFLIVGLVFYGVYMLIHSRTKNTPTNIHSIDTVIIVATTGLLWLTLNYTDSLNRDKAFSCFVLGLSAHLSMMGCYTSKVLGCRKYCSIYSLLVAATLLVFLIKSNSLNAILWIIPLFIIASFLTNKIYLRWQKNDGDTSLATILKQSVLALGLSFIGLINT